MFEEYYGLKSTPGRIREYMVENPKTGEMQIRSLHSNEKQLYFSVSFRKDKNNKDQYIGMNAPKLNCIPNPVTNTCRIQYELAAKAFVKLEVFDIYGNHQNTIYSGLSEEGKHEISWNINDSKGNALPNGVYLISLKTATHKTQIKTVITK
ncbi:MAG: FlgD immunoglobulin-like domain containing protein [Bacteroidota bacterium]|nr:FlgD immunoglobulin-like domain containing protein [Bacteroidota bacterium]